MKGSFGLKIWTARGNERLHKDNLRYIQFTTKTTRRTGSGLTATLEVHKIASGLAITWREG
jgi:hypothetical protein